MHRQTLCNSVVLQLLQWTLYDKLVVLSCAGSAQGRIPAAVGAELIHYTRIRAEQQVKYCGGIFEFPHVRLIILRVCENNRF